MAENKDFESLKKMSYGFFSVHSCTPTTIDQFIDTVGRSVGLAGMDRDELFDLLERMHQVTIYGTDAVLDDHGDHEEWFNPSTGVGLNREIDWHFWSHYETFLISGKNWPKDVVANLDSETNKILSRIEDPHRTGQWDRRGMVIGSVQSGKTANYTGLIAKAIDAGYKLIVVLAGVHNSLRSQTQFRLNDEILGYHLDKVEKFSDQARVAGVREMFPDHKIIQTLTNATDLGDFNKPAAVRAGIVPNRSGPATILVVKKHVSILKNLVDWATSIIGRRDSKNRYVVEDVPMLVIDDECDYASVNTKRVALDENGKVDPECDPTKTNQRIRELLATFHQSVYVGYTATPFANIFIHHEQSHPVYGSDIFPRNFIACLPQPTNYTGPERLFGLNANEAAGIGAKPALPLLREVVDGDVVFPPSHKKDLAVGILPDSMKEAIRAFLIACAVRRIRNSSPAHNSMLVHVTRFTDVQAQVHSLIERELKKYVSRIRSGTDSLADFKTLWDSDFVTTSTEMKDEFGASIASWEEVVANLYPVVRRIKVKSINGSAKESLDYRLSELETRSRQKNGEVVPWEERGENVISVGGDKLSRGLTLDGLTVSYYLRASKMYDTLMQMGRWFGYREGYEDLCRIYTTSSLSTWYRFIATATIELKNELKYMELVGMEPREFGLKVLDHPGQLAVTSAGKRRNSQKIKLSFSGRRTATIVFDLAKAESNFNALTKLIEECENEVGRPNTREDKKLIYNNVSPDNVIRYLEAYQTDAEAAKVVDPRRIAQFIKDQQAHGNNDLTEWSVAVISVSSREFQLAGHSLSCAERIPNAPIEGNCLKIGTLISPSDEWLDFSEEERQILIAQNGGDLTGEEIRGKRPPNRGLLIVYPICSPNDSKYGEYGRAPDPIVTGIAVSFPASKTTREVEYQVNAVFQDAEE